MNRGFDMDHFFIVPGKGDLVGCDLNVHVLANGQITNASAPPGADTVVKSSSDVKVRQISQSFYRVVVLESHFRS